jgi:hypothetical protein
MPFPDHAKVDKKDVVVFEPGIRLGTLLERPQGVFTEPDQDGMPDPFHPELLQDPLALAHRFRLKHSGLNPGRHLFDDLPRFVARVMHRFENELLADRLLCGMLHGIAHSISPASLYSDKYIDGHQESPFSRLEANGNGMFWISGYSAWNRMI